MTQPSKPNTATPYKPLQNEQHPGQKSAGTIVPRKDAPTGKDKDLVGTDTDGDGKVVKPGQKPGQSHGQGLPNNK